MAESVFSYKGSELFVEDVSLDQLAEELGTPLYVYSTKAILDNLASYQKAFADRPHLIAYSVKAASNLAILSLVQKQGGGADIVSGGELFRALKAGIDPQKIVFSGVGKTKAEMAEALKAGILSFNVESAPELAALSQVAQSLGLKAPIAFRVNPDVDPQTHPYVATGFRDSKFGVPVEEALKLYKVAQEDPNIEIVGLDCHIGSQLTSLGPFKATAERLLVLLGKIKALGLELKILDLGGGLGIDYYDQKDPDKIPPLTKDYARAFSAIYQAYPGLTIVLEPGRSVVGPAGVLLVTTLYDKITPFKRFFITDGAMNDLIRPSLYGSYHNIKPVKDQGRPAALVNVVGPVCESGDFLAQDRALPIVQPGERLAVFGAGAYGFSMASNYNSRARSAEVLVNGATFRIIRTRETREDLIRGETL
ncbi:MAG: diaminopimelate decarboxylase [Deltaproteobacteria bacterium]|jgi:diaminopimelate decarboxylase|nr:diaminopimelate decarboxylase [Deltaproteobacteria bacterium]